MSTSVMQIQQTNQYPLLRATFKDEGVATDLTDRAVWFDFYVGETFHSRRPARLATPKSSGTLEVFLNGRDTDFDGVRTELVAYPFMMVPFAEDGTPATNLLLNPGMDVGTGTNPNKVATSWSLSSARVTAVYDVYCNDTKPACLFEGGAFQLVSRVTPGEIDNVEQSVSVSVLNGQWVSAGVWVRGASIQGAQNSSNALQIRSTGVMHVTTQFPVGSFDWRFVTAERQLLADRTDLIIRLVTTGNLGGWRFDDAALFLGRYKKLPLQPMRVEVVPKKRPPKTSNQIGGFGRFDRDSNADGVPDGWMHDGGGTGNPWGGVTLSLNSKPANLQSGMRHSLQVDSTGGAAGTRILHVERRAFKKDDVWEFSIWVKYSATLTVLPTIQLLTDEFVCDVRTSGSLVQFPVTAAAWTQVVTTITLLGDADAMEMKITFGQVDAGATLYLSDAQFKRLIPA